MKARLRPLSRIIRCHTGSVERKRIMGAVSRIGLFTSALAGLALLFSCQAASAQEPGAANKDAVGAAQTFLAMVDQGKYAESWDFCATALKEGIKKGSWYAILDANRAKLGKLQSRKFESEQTATALVGAPDGHYVLLKYRASFENRKTVPYTEIVTVMQDEDKQWRVFRYSVRRTRPLAP
jgi:hypothetical protein